MKIEGKEKCRYCSYSENKQHTEEVDNIAMLLCDELIRCIENTDRISFTKQEIILRLHKQEKALFTHLIEKWKQK